MGAYIASTVADGVAGQRSCAILWNPEGSAVNLLLDAVSFTHSTLKISGVEYAAGGDMYVISAPLGTLIQMGTSKDLSDPVGVGEIRGHHYPEGTPPWGSMKPIMEFWSPDWDDESYPIVPPITIPPGKGLAVAGSFNQLWLPITLQYRSEPV